MGHARALLALPDDIAQRRVAREVVAGHAQVRPARDVREHEGLGLQHPHPLDDVLDVHVHADLGALAVVGLEERAFAEHDLRRADVVADQVRPRRGG